MLDIQYIRDNSEKVAEKSQQKGYEVDIPQLLEVDERRRSLQTQVDELRAKRNEHASSLQGGKPSDEQIAAGKAIKDQLSGLEEDLSKVEAKFTQLLMAVPNVAADDVPVGDESASVEVKKVGDQKTGGQDHLDLALKHDWVDFERGAKVAGNKFYFLKGDLALLENALTQFAINFVTEHGFKLMTVPHMVSSKVVTGTGFAPRTSDQSDEYYIDGEDLSLIGTSEMSLTGYHADEIIDEEDLPLMYAGVSACYRKEAGTYGKHTRGLYRVHQFNKVEMYVLTLLEDSWDTLEKLRQFEEYIWQAIGIPYRVINIASGDLGAPAAKKYDLEYWSPVDKAYRELTSCSNCTDFQARNMNIRVRRQDGRVETLHTLNATAVATTRSLIPILENFQNPDGSVTVPEVLRPYMNGKETIG